MSCEGCAETYEVEDDEPPCDECDKPKLMRRNYLAWGLWQMLNEFERRHENDGPASIPITTMLDVCHAYGGDERDTEKMQLIERTMLPWIQKQERPKGDQ